MGWFGAAVVLALGFYWCYAVMSRWREDLQEFREIKDSARRVGILVVWAMTILLALALVSITFALTVVTISELRAWSRVS
jgi:hypothetical protein